MNTTNKYTVTKTPAIKNTITITRNQLWENFVDSWKDMARDDFDTFKDFVILKEVGEILCKGELDWKVRKLFMAGHTFMLMGDAMQFIDDGKDTFPEIVVVDGEKQVVVECEYIRY